jgi:hypothetical protein
VYVPVAPSIPLIEMTTVPDRKAVQESVDPDP